MSDTNRNDGNHGQVQDNEQYYQRRRLEEIGDARRDAAEKRTQAEAYAKQLVAQSDNPTARTWEARSAYRTAVENYIREVEPLLTDRFPEQGLPRWDDQTLGTLTVQPPEFLKDEPRGVELTNRPTPQQFEFTGLSSLLATRSPIPVTFKATKNARHRLEEDVEKTVPAEPSFAVLDRAFRSVNLFLAEIGLEVDVTQQEGPWEI